MFRPRDLFGQTRIDALPDDGFKTYLQRTICNEGKAIMALAENRSNGGSSPPPSDPVTAVPVVLMNALDGQDIHNAPGSPSDVLWAGMIIPEYFVMAGADFVAQEDMEINLYTSVGIIGAGVNNRTVYCLNIKHDDYSYYQPSLYVRDDNNAYDSGILAGQLRMFVAAGDRITIQVIVLDTQTTGGNVQPDTTFSQLRIERISSGSN